MLFQKENDNTVFEEVNAPVRPVTEKALEQIAEKRKKDNWLSKGETRKVCVDYFYAYVVLNIYIFRMQYPSGRRNIKADLPKR